jgi:bifunctional enzyme CysN/CysC
VTAETDLIADDIEAYLDLHARKDLLRFITCGSVDDGKSTLIGRMLHEAQVLFEDQLATLEAESKTIGTRGGEIDYALLLDGLTAEREQGITIDVAYRFFSTDRRKFIVADTPGHEQYTRNMVTGASTADLAVILIDARKGVLVQTRRHSYLVSLLGIRHVVLAVNKMDLVDYDEQRFGDIVGDYREFARGLGIEFLAIPISAVNGDNVISRSERTPWYTGPTLMEHLDTAEVTDGKQSLPFRMPVQWVNRPHLDFRGFSGTVASGVVRPGDAIRVLPSGRESHVASIVTYDGPLDAAVADQSVTLTLTDEIDVSRGDVIASREDPPEVAQQFEATIIWMSDDALLRGRSYLLKIGTRTATATVAPLRYKINVNTLEQVPANRLELNEIGVGEVELDRPIAFDAYRRNREMGSFILIDRVTNNTVGAGLIHHALRRMEDLQRERVDITKDVRAAQKSQRPCVVWLTGIPGSGKTTIANLLDRRLHVLGHHAYLLDGDNVRHGLSKDLGFSDEDRVENIRRISEVASLMVDAGLIVIASFISPFRAERRAARDLVADGEFIEVFIDTPIEVAERRDRKGLYRRARAGEIANFTGVDSPYEAPEAPEVHIPTVEMTPDQAVDRIVEELRRRGIIRG